MSGPPGYGPTQALDNGGTHRSSAPEVRRDMLNGSPSFWCACYGGLHGARPMVDDSRVAGVGRRAMCLRDLL